MTKANLDVWGGLVSAAVGVMLILFGILPMLMLPVSQPLLAWVTDADWGLLNGFALIMTLLTPLAVVSLYSVQVEESAKLGFTGFVIAFIGSVLFACVQFDEALLWPVFVTQAPGLLDPTGPMFSSPAFSMTYLLMGVMYIVGFVLFGIASLRASVLPRVAAVLLIVGIPLFAGGMFLPFILRALGAGLAGVGLIWMGLRTSGQASRPGPRQMLSKESV